MIVACGLTPSPVGNNDPSATKSPRTPWRSPAAFTPEVRGWASAPDGVARVTLWIDNHSVAIPATLAPDPSVTRHFHMDAVTFRGVVHKDTDLEVEIISRGGRSTLLPEVSVSGRSR